MGKARLQRVLQSIKDVEQSQVENLARDVKTSAQIFAVAQYATQRLAEVTAPVPEASPDVAPIPQLPDATSQNDVAAEIWCWDTLKQCYGSAREIRAALKRDRGINFAKSPCKADLVAAWNGELPATAKRIRPKHSCSVNLPSDSPSLENSLILEHRVAALEAEVRSLRSLLETLLAQPVSPP